MRDLTYRRVCFCAIGMALALAGACGNSPGESCRKDSECGASLVCTFPKVDGAPAKQGVCAPRLAEAGQFCTSSASCASGLFCSNDLPSEVSKPDGLCIPRLAEGEECFRDAACSSGLECRTDTANRMVCTATSLPDAGSVNIGPVDGGEGGEAGSSMDGVGGID